MNFKQTLFISYYTEGETKGNCEQSMLKAGYKAGYARKWSGCYIGAIRGIKKAIEDKIKAINIAWEDRISRVNARLDAEIAKTTNISSLCLLVNAQKGYVDMQAKNEGKYALDNAQRTEQDKLTEVQVEEAKQYAKWRLIQGLTEPEVKKKEVG